jgi:hypothetical protein
MAASVSKTPFSFNKLLFQKLKIQKLNFYTYKRNKIEEAALHASISKHFANILQTKTKQKRKTIHIFFYKNKQRADILSDIKIMLLLQTFCKQTKTKTKRRKNTYF